MNVEETYSNIQVIEKPEDIRDCFKELMFVLITYG